MGLADGRRAVALRTWISSEKAIVLSVVMVGGDSMKENTMSLMAQNTKMTILLILAFLLLVIIATGDTVAASHCEQFSNHYPGFAPDPSHPLPGCSG